MQRQQPIVFASRGLIDTERGCAQTEKEILAVLFWMEWLHQLTFGHKVDMKSDHQPLESMKKKPLLSDYHTLVKLHCYEAGIRLCPGKLVLAVDTLSRAQQRVQHRWLCGTGDALSTCYNTFESLRGGSMPCTKQFGVLQAAKRVDTPRLTRSQEASITGCYPLPPNQMVPRPWLGALRKRLRHQLAWCRRIRWNEVLATQRTNRTEQQTATGWKQVPHQ